MRLKDLRVPYIAIEALLYAVFMYLDLTGGSSSVSAYIKYASILLCALFAAFVAVRRKTGISVLVAVAFLFTAGADLFLLFTDRYLPGVLCFCMVQTLYLAVILNAKKSLNRLPVHMAVGLPAAAAAVLLGIKLDTGELFLVGAAGFYAYSFIRNIVLAFGLCRRSTDPGSDTAPLHKGLFAAGLLIFALCDINVLLYNLSDFVTLESAFFSLLLRFAGDFMWMFYLPGQIMLSLSSDCFRTDSDRPFQNSQ